ncbi:MAG: hypothetical protein FOGNACKC_03328 [Anaerolineae bacterium]|nr:hypothetical protein [Anaerolineae bacterium]
MRIIRGLLFQLILWIVAPLVVITVVSALTIYVNQQAVRTVAVDRATRLALVMAASLSHRLAEYSGVLQTLADAEAVHPNDRPAQQSALEQAEDARALFNDGLALLDPAGAIVARSNGGERWLSYPAVAAIQAQVAATDRPDFWPLPLDATFDQGLVLLAVPVKSKGSPESSRRGEGPGSDGSVLIGAFSPAQLRAAEVLADLESGNRGVSYVVDSRGQIIYHPRAELAGQTDSHRPEIEQLKTDQAGALVYTDAGNESWVVGYAPVPVVAWGVIIQEPWAEIVNPNNAQSSAIPLVLVILAALVSLAAVYLMMYYVIRPLRALDHVAGQFGWGHLTAIETPVGGVQEIKDLHVTLRQMAEQIQQYQTGLQSYTAAVTQGQEAERTRLARELHDDTAQSLVGLIQRIKLAQRDLKHNPARTAERLSELEALASTAWQEVRRFSEDLRPSYLEQLGLVPALTVLVEQGKPQSEPEVSLTVAGPEQRLSPALELAVFRIVQEGLNNVRHHSQAAHVAVELTFASDGLSLSIEDDGRGFEPPRLPYDLTRQGHFGLAGMHERVSLVGGRLSIDSARGRGTRIVAFVPYHRPS